MARRGFAETEQADVKGSKMGIAPLSTDGRRLDNLRGILAQLRDETYEKIADFRRDRAEAAQPQQGDEMDVARSSADDETHANLIERAEDRLRLIDEALARIDNGSYGTCAECGDDIPVERLKALPFALFCIDCQTKRSRVRGRWGTKGSTQPYIERWSTATLEEPEVTAAPAVEDTDDVSIIHDDFEPEEGMGGEPAPKRRRGRPRKVPAAG